MNHDDVIVYFPDLIAERLGFWRRWRVNRHLRSCEPCRSVLADYKQIHSEIQEGAGRLMRAPEPSAELYARIAQTIDEFEAPSFGRRTRLPGRRLVRVQIVAVLALAVAVAFAIFLPDRSASALNVATPIRASIRITEGESLVAAGDLSFISAQEWQRTLRFERIPEAVPTLEEIAVNNMNYMRSGGGEWEIASASGAGRQPISGLGDLGNTDRLIDAVLNEYDLQKIGEVNHAGRTLVEYTGLDAGFVERLRLNESNTGTNDLDPEIISLHTTNPPVVRVLADDQERIRAIFITVQQVDVEPLQFELEITEFNASVTIPTVFP